MAFQTVVYDKQDAIARVTLNRPAVLNAYNIQMRDDLCEVFTAVRDDPEVRALIVSGVGRAYCAGADLSEFGTAPSPVIAREVRWARDLWGVLKDLDKVTIAAMHGYAFGSGLELALFCDFRLAAEGTRFGLPETSLGFIPAAGGTQSLARVVKPAAALRLILTGQRIDAGEALRLGLVQRVVPKETLLAEAEGLARRVLEAAPLAVVLAKRALNEGLELGLEDGLALERRLGALALGSADAREGLRACLEGRAPVFTGG